MILHLTLLLAALSAENHQLSLWAGWASQAQQTGASAFFLVKVLDLWVDSFNPEFIERSMAGVIRDLMLALWAHIQPHPSPHGTKASHIRQLSDFLTLACSMLKADCPSRSCIIVRDRAYFRWPSLKGAVPVACRVISNCVFFTFAGG